MQEQLPRHEGHEEKQSFKFNTLKASCSSCLRGKKCF